MSLQIRPDEAMASRLTRSLLGVAPSRIARFPTGSRHYVYDVVLPDDRCVVMRIGDHTAHREIAGAVELSRLLRPMGVPLPELLAEDAGAELPWMALERLPGTDLGGVFANLSRAQLATIAKRVASAQALIGTTSSAGRYGISASPAAAPYDSWSAVVMAHVERSRRRILQAGLFDIAVIDDLERLIAQAKPTLDAMAATPFLHDTTTKNVIIDRSGEMSGIVDVDDLGFGDARHPIALTCAALLTSGDALDYPRFWLAEMGGESDRIFQIYVATFLLDFMSEHGLTFNGNLPASEPEARRVLLKLYQEQVALAGGTVPPQQEA